MQNNNPSSGGSSGNTPPVTLLQAQQIQGRIVQKHPELENQISDLVEGFEWFNNYYTTHHQQTQQSQANQRQTVPAGSGPSGTPGRSGS